MDCDDLDTSYSSQDEADNDLYIDSSESETVDDEDYLVLGSVRSDDQGAQSHGMRTSYSAQSLPLALGPAWPLSSPPASSPSFRHNIPLSAPDSPSNDAFSTYHHLGSSDSLSTPDDSILKASSVGPNSAPAVPSSLSSPLLRVSARPSSSGPSSTMSCVPGPSEHTYHKVTSHGTRAMSLDAAQMAQASNQSESSLPVSNNRPRVSFRLDLTALTSSKPMVRVISQPELNRHAIATESVYKSSSSSAIYGVPNFGGFGAYPSGPLMVTQSHPDFRSAGSWPPNLGFSSSNPLGFSSIPHDTLIQGGIGAAPSFAQRQDSLSRRLEVRPSVERLVQHNILFGPDISPSISAAARAYKWRRRGDELNHRLSRRASRDSLIEHNILRLEATNQTQQRFRKKQVDLADRIGTRSSRESLVQRNILVTQNASSPSSMHKQGAYKGSGPHSA